MSSFLSNGDPAAIEGLYEQYCKNPESIDSEWRNFFQGFEFSRTEFDENDENKGEVIPNTKFSNPLKTIFYKYIKNILKDYGVHCGTRSATMIVIVYNARYNIKFCI